MAFRAAIVGCGLIGSEFSATDSLPGVWSHAQAYSANPDTELVAVCDANLEKLEKCASRWGVPGKHSDFSTMLRAENPDIVSICTPDATHFELIKLALLHPSVRAVFAEKPLASRLEEAEELVNMAEKKGVLLAVNHTRRYAPGFIRLQKNIASGFIGKIQAVSGLYTKGTLHNGSHWFDLANYLLGPVACVSGFDSLKEQNGDPTLNVRLEFANGAPGSLLACDADAFAVFEMDIIGVLGRARIADSGFTIEIYHLANSPFGAGYKKLALAEKIAGGLGEALPNAVADLVRCLKEGGAPLCSGQDALRALRIGFAAQHSAKTGSPVDLRNLS